MFVESVVPESGLITLRAYSAPQSTKDKRSKSWEKVKFLQLIQEIAGRHGLTVETYGITDQTYDYVEQNNLPDFAFLQARCTLEGAAFLVYDGKLVVYDEAYMEGQQPVDTITITPANDFEYRDEGAYAYGSARGRQRRPDRHLLGAGRGRQGAAQDPPLPHDRPSRGRPASPRACSGTPTKRRPSQRSGRGRCCASTRRAPW